MIKNDKWIIEQSQKGMIQPFESSLIRQIKGRHVISYGVSSYGYDLTLSELDFRIFQHIPGSIVDPKDFRAEHLQLAKLHHKADGSKYFVLPGNTYALGVSKEKIAMLSNVTAKCIGKSTYARTGVIVNVTPIEAGWCGHITLEFSNASSADTMIYANEGVAQLLFFEGEPCLTSYADRGGKYQNQSAEVTLPRV